MRFFEDLGEAFLIGGVFKIGQILKMMIFYDRTLFMMANFTFKDHLCTFTYQKIKIFARTFYF